MMILLLAAYFLLLMVISRVTSRGADNVTFFRAHKQSPWYLVAFGMIGASVSGISFVSVPGMVLTSGMTYLQTCMGFVLGYVAVAFILLPLYYGSAVTSIYSYLRSLGPGAYKTGALFFLLSKMTGTAAKFYVPCYLIAEALHIDVPFPVVVVVMTLLIWLYTRKGGIKTLVWTDTLQTACMILALILIMLNVAGRLGMSWGELATAVSGSDYSRVFEFDDWTSPRYFWKQFLSGIFIVIVMTGLDQDMMQKNLTCRSLRDAQKDMCTYGLAFLPVNALFLVLGVMLVMLCNANGVAVPEHGDSLLTSFAATGQLGDAVLILFSLGIISSSFSSADSALTAITTTLCVDIIGRMDSERLRKFVHAAVAVCFVLCVVAFKAFEGGSLIDTIYTLVSYTYGPLLGLFSYTIIYKERQKALHGGLVAMVCVLSPAICYALNIIIPEMTGYHFGYELLMLNGLLTFLGLKVIRVT